jgi:hypothetical protein
MAMVSFLTTAHARKHIAVPQYVVAEDLGEIPPILEPSIQSLVTCPYPPMHNQLLPRIGHVFGDA